MKLDAIVGATDFNSPNGPILPWLRSVDGLNTHDDAYELAMAGGVTSAQVLPGTSNVIGRHLRCESNPSILKYWHFRWSGFYREIQKTPRPIRFFHDC
jgi:hypothetical protein